MAYVFALLIVVAEVINVSARSSLYESAREQREESLAREVATLARAASQYLANEGEVPVSIASMVSNANYAHLRFYSDNNINSDSASGITDGRYEYNRFLVYGQVSLNPKSHSDYLNANSCGANFNSQDWCGDRASYWSIVEERSIYRRLEAQTNRQVEKVFITLARKLAHGESPKVLNDGSEMADGDTVSLATAVGFGGTADSCSGTFSFEGVTLDCRSLFDVYGNPITYTRLSDYGFAVAAELNAKYNDGDNILIVKAGEFQ